jgi:unsaturated rhamnogalacturonyl hydrolase
LRNITWLSNFFAQANTIEHKNVMRLLSSIFTIMLFALSVVACGQGIVKAPEQTPWSRQIADSFISRHPGAVTYDSGSPNQKWNYEQGFMLVALYKLWLQTNDRRYFDFVQKNLDQFIDTNGIIKTYKMSDFNCDNIAGGRTLLGMYKETKQERYRIAADSLRKQLHDQPRTSEGGFWHKKIYPYQMWLDGLYMAEPFYAGYAAMFNEPNDFDDIASQFLRMTAHTRDPKTGLLYHAWDERKKERWANSETGCSPTFWARSMGWYAMALVDVLDYLPADHSNRAGMTNLLRKWASSVLKFRDEQSKMWYQVVDRGQQEGNYLETSASCMFAYVFTKGVNDGYLGKEFLTAARETFQGVIVHSVTREANGFIDLRGTCGAVGLGGSPYRDGSFKYYAGVPAVVNDKRGIGAFLLAAIELEKADKSSSGSSK